MAADRIKGITIEIDGDTTKLSKALKDVNSELKSSQSNLKDIDKLLKLDPGNTELLQQKYKNLGTSIEDTKKKLETLKTAQEQAARALANGDISQEEFDSLQREIVETEQKLKGLETEFKNFGSVAAQQVAVAGEKMKTMGSKVEGVGQAIMPASAAVIGLGAAAVKTTSDFDSAMSTVSAVSGATGTDLETLRDKAKEMGEKTVFSASEAAEAMNYMAMAGWKTTDMVGGIEGVMNLAAASGEDLATTSDIVTDALTAFGLTASDSGHFADVLAAASSNANTNVSMMGETFKYAAPVAGALGYSVEDTAEAIGLMANAGIKSTQAGTSLRTILTQLNGEIAISGDKLGDVTIQTTNADGSMRDLSDILGDCRSAFSQLSESEQASTAEALVGKNAMSGFLALMNASEGDINKLSGAIDKCNGSAKTMADTKLDNLEGQIKLLKSQLEALAISFGEIIMPFVLDFVKGLQGVLNWLNSLSEGQKKVIVTIAAVVAVAGPLLVMVGKFMIGIGQLMTYAPKIVSAFGTIKTLIGTVGGALKGLWAICMANPIVLIIAAIAALVAGFVYLWNTSDSFRQFWIDLWNGLKEAVSTAINAIGSFFTETIPAVFGAVINFFKENWQGILLLLVNPFVGAFKLLYDNCEGFRTFINNILENIKLLISTAWEAIKTAVSTAVTAIQTTVTTIWNAIATFFQTVLTTIQTIFSTIWNAIVSFITTTFTTLQTLVSTAWEAIKTTISTVMNAIKTVITTIWNAIKTVISTIMNGIKTVFTTAWNAIKTTVTTVVNGVKTAIQNGLNSAKSTVENILGAIKNKFQSIWDGVKSIVSGAIDRIKSLMNFHWELPHLKLPHFSISGSFSLNPPSVPHFGIDWYKKAMADGMILNSPTIFGAAGGNLLAGGEAGPEAVVGVDSLRSMITDAVTNASGSGSITIPVYIGNRKLDTVVVDAVNRNNYRSGGR